MIYLFLFLIAFFASPINATAELNAGLATSPQLLPQLRIEFHLAENSQSKTLELIRYLEQNINGNWPRQPTAVYAYYGALKGLEAKFAFNPLGKMRCLKASISILDQAVQTDNDDFEVRYIRYVSYCHYPNILGVSGKREGDLKYLLTRMEKRDFGQMAHSLRKEMVAYLLENKLIKDKKASVLLNQINRELASQ